MLVMIYSKLSIPLQLDIWDKVLNDENETISDRKNIL